MIGGQIRSVVPWSRLFDTDEIVLAINTDADRPRAAWVTIDDTLHPAPGELACLYSTDAAQIGTRAAIEARDGKAVRLVVPPAGFVVYR